MITHSRLHRKFPTPQPHRPPEHLLLNFSDASIIPLSGHRFIGTGDSSPVVDELEESFLGVARIIDRPLLIEQMTACIKQPNSDFGPIVVDLIRCSSRRGRIQLTSDSILASLEIPGQTVRWNHMTYHNSIQFPTRLLHAGDLLAVRVQPSGPITTFYISVSVS